VKEAAAHVFAVRAINPTGNADPTPTTTRFKVKLSG
jgi:hypothetical protein